MDKADVRAPALVVNDAGGFVAARLGLPELLEVAVKISQVGQLAAQLARPDVAITVTHNRRPVLDLRAARDEEAVLARIGKLCGEQFAGQTLRIDRENDGIALSGWIGLPTFNRSQADLQYWFVNGRSITDKTLSHAVRHA